MQERIGFDEAVAALLRAVAPVETVETVDRDDAVGRVLASPPTAADAVPPSPRATRPGRAIDADATAGATRDGPAVFDDAPPVAAGDPLPADADAVAPSSAVARHGDRVEVADRLVPGAGVVETGAVVAADDPVLHRGTVVRPSDAAVLARAGVEHCEVYDRPRVAVGCAEGPVGAAVRATLRRVGCEPVDEGEGTALVVTVSDRTEERAGAPTIFDGVAASPGEETVAWEGPPPTVSLVPEPATVLVVEPLLGPVAGWLARRPFRPRRGDVRLTAKTSSTVGETTFVGVRVEDGRASESRPAPADDAKARRTASQGVPAATPVGPRTSHDAVIRIPEHVEGHPEDAIVTARYTEV